MHDQRETTSLWLIAFRIVFTLALLGTIVFIFKNSMQAADLSDARSQAILAKVNALLSRLGVTGVTNHAVRKAAHFLEYCLEGFWLMLCLRVYTRRFVRHVSWPLLGALLTALTDETIQLFYKGRSGQLSDVWLDFSGSVAGLMVALFVLVFFHMCGAMARYGKMSREAEQRLQREQHTPQLQAQPEPRAAPRPIQTQRHSRPAEPSAEIRPRPIQAQRPGRPMEPSAEIRIEYNKENGQ